MADDILPSIAAINGAATQPAPQPDSVLPSIAAIGPQPQTAASSTQTAQPWTGNVLPFSGDAQGNIHFDPHAGLLGTIISAVTAPGDAYYGKLDPLSPEGNRRALDLAGLISPVNPAVRAGDYAIPGVIKNLQKAPTLAPSVDALKDAAGAGYNAARATGATYPGTVVGTAAQNTIDELQNDGILPELAPQTHSVLNKLANPPPGSTVNIASLDAARKAFNRIGGNFQNPTEQAASQRAINAIDQIVQAGGEAPSVAGTSAAANPGTAIMPGAGGIGTTLGGTTPEAEAARLIQDARGNSAAAFRSDRLTNAEDAAELRSAAANSGQNIGNTLRQKLASLLINPKTARGYSPDELDAIRQVVQGTATSNILRHVSNMLGGGGGIGHTLIGGLGAVTGGLMAGPEGAGVGAIAAPMAGSVARHAYNSLIQRQLDNAAQAVRMRSPLYAEIARNAPLLAGSYALPSLSTRGAVTGLLGQPQQ